MIALEFSREMEIDFILDLIRNDLASEYELSELLHDRLDGMFAGADDYGNFLIDTSAVLCFPISIAKRLRKNLSALDEVWNKFLQPVAIKYGAIITSDGQLYLEMKECSLVDTAETNLSFWREWHAACQRATGYVKESRQRHQAVNRTRKGRFCDA